MAEERRNRLSPQGRLRCAASGSANLRRWKESRPDVLALVADIESFEADLIAQVGEPMTATKRGLVLAAVATYRGLKLADGKLSLSRRRTRHLEELVGLLPPLAGSLLRSFRALGLDNGVPDGGDAPNGPSIEDLRREYAERGVAP